MGSQYYYANITGPQSAVIEANDLLIDLGSINQSGTYNVLLSFVQQGGLLGFYYLDQNFLVLEKNNEYYNFQDSDISFYTQIDQQINHF